ncbi:MAG TPA: membrane protein insertion efficiency factor YidD [Candidatus Kapabacteria bacterium]|jgi:putative membrane protein insertion efficiency factor|nr:membrane protein insertion efficiency factor YidD [Candidatus Kapabacteria bacterium]HOV92474.1 membrane protein insertion efficiency factor YidD [Candidatus Kapabacteria bacterium]
MKKILIKLIKIYKKFISPALPPSCRFYPTCSSYAIEAIDKHGIFYGSALSIWRILRCNPFNKGGIDPVPENIKKFYIKELKFR